MKPFIYYAINKYKIEAYLTIELNGDDPHLVKRDLLKPYIKKFIEDHLNGVDTSAVNNYVNYICTHVSLVS